MAAEEREKRSMLDAILGKMRTENKVNPFSIKPLRYTR